MLLTAHPLCGYYFHFEHCHWGVIPIPPMSPVNAVPFLVQLFSLLCFSSFKNFVSAVEGEGHHGRTQLYLPLKITPHSLGEAWVQSTEGVRRLRVALPALWPRPAHRTPLMLVKWKVVVFDQLELGSYRHEQLPGCATLYLTLENHVVSLSYIHMRARTHTPSHHVLSFPSCLLPCL